jgi:hypothetical protein
MVSVKATAVSNLTIAGLAVGASGLVPIGFGFYLRNTIVVDNVARDVGNDIMGAGLILLGAGMTLAGVIMILYGTDRKPQEVSSRGAATAYSPTIVLAPGGVGFRAPLW